MTVRPMGKYESAGKPKICTVGGPALSVALGLVKVDGNGISISLSVYNTMSIGHVELKDGGSRSAMILSMKSSKMHEKNKEKSLNFPLNVYSFAFTS